MRCVTCGEPGASGVAACPSCGAGRADLEAAFSEAPAVVGRPRIGQDFGTRYLVIKLLGMGGMGVVYQALDRDLGVHVALKVLRPAGGSPKAAAEMQRRFKSELLLARQITHRNVIRIHDIGEINGIRFISMPFVEGGDLATILKPGPLSLERALRYARQLASGLMAVHAAGVIHRDLKPANIMIGEHDQALLMDFGIARSSAPGTPPRTIPGAIVGTAAYMAPEQARGEPADPRTDIYAFGLILYEMIAGPRKVSAADLIARMKGAPTPLRQLNPHVPEALEAIVTRCLHPNAANRYQNAVELATALSALSRQGRGRTPVAAVAKRWLPRAAAAALLAALASVAYWTTTHGGVSALARSILPVNAAAQSAGRVSRPSGLRQAQGRPGPGRETASSGSPERVDGRSGPGVSRAGAGTDATGYLEVTVVPKAGDETRTVLGKAATTPSAARTNAAADAIHRGNFSAAARQAEQAIAADPQWYTAYVPLAAAAALTAPATARAPYERMAATGPAGASLAAAGLADLALYEGRHAAAAAILEAAIAADLRTPNRAGLATKYLALAEARAGQGRRADAVVAIRQALTTSRDGSVLLPAARLLITLHLEGEARALAKELGADKDGNIRAYGRIIDAELALGRGDTAGAIETLRIALKTTDLWLVRFVLGTAYLQSAQFPEALAELEMCEIRRGEATTLFLDDTPSIRYLGMLQYLLARAREGAGLTRQAAADFREFLILRTGSPNGTAERDARERLERLPK